MIRDRAREVLGHVVRVRGDEADPRDLRDLFVDAREQAGERGPVVEVESVGVDALAEQRHLEHAVLREPPHLVDDVVDRPAPLAALRERDDAERAELVAAPHDRDERLVLARARRDVALEGDLLLVDREDALAVPDLVEEVRDVLEAVGARRRGRRGARARRSGPCGSAPCSP